MSEGDSEARSCPPISPKWLQFQFGMIRMDQWDLWDMSASSFGDGGHAKSSVDPKRWMEVVLFVGKISMLEGDPVTTFGKQSHPSDCIFRF